MVWSCFPFIRSGQNHLARYSERRKKTRQTEEEVGRQHQEMDRPGVRQVLEGSGEQGKMETVTIIMTVTKVIMTVTIVIMALTIVIMTVTYRMA